MQTDKDKLIKQASELLNSDPSLFKQVVRELLDMAFPLQQIEAENLRAATCEIL